MNFPVLYLPSQASIMRPVGAQSFLRALRLLLLLAACGWAPAVTYPIWSNPDEMMHLYTASPSRSFHLQMYADGRVQGTPYETVDSAVLLKTGPSGYLSIIGVKSGLFLCMHCNGTLYGSSTFSYDCVFKCHRLENTFDVYESVKHDLVVSLGKVKGRLVPGKELPPFSKFIPGKNGIPLNWFNQRR